MKEGYLRLTATDTGETAAELMQQVRSQLATSGKTEVVSSIIAIFDRTVYLSVPAVSGEYESSVVAVGVNDLRSGPLLIRAETPVGFSFRNHCQEVSTCRIKIEGSGGLTLGIGPTLIIKIQPTIIDSPDYCTNLSQYSYRQFVFGSEPVRSHAKLLTWLDSEISDGIGHLNTLKQIQIIDGLPSYENVPLSFTNFVSIVIAELGGYNLSVRIGASTSNVTSSENNTPNHTLSTPKSYIGYGPGATPAGDDVLAGLLLALQGLNDERVQAGVNQFINRLISDAENQSTGVSVALLRQAAEGRASKPVKNCLESLLVPEPSLDVLKRRSDSIFEIGHTSGVATLAGLLTATMVVFPHLQQRLK